MEATPEERTPPARPRLEYLPTPLPTATTRPHVKGAFRDRSVASVARRATSMRAAEEAEEDQEGVSLRREVDAKIQALERELLGAVQMDTSPSLLHGGGGPGNTPNGDRVVAATPSPVAVGESEATRLRRLAAIEAGVWSASAAAAAVGRVGAGGLRAWRGGAALRAKAKGGTGVGARDAPPPSREDDASAIAELERELEAELRLGEEDVRRRVERVKAGALGGTVPVGAGGQRAWRVDELLMHRLDSEVADIESSVLRLGQRRRPGGEPLLSPATASRLVDDASEPLGGGGGTGQLLPSPGRVRLDLQLLHSREVGTGEAGVDAVEIPDSSRLSEDEGGKRKTGKDLWRGLARDNVAFRFLVTSRERSRRTFELKMQDLLVEDAGRTAHVFKGRKKFVEGEVDVDLPSGAPEGVDEAMVEVARRSIASRHDLLLVKNVARVKSRLRSLVASEHRKNLAYDKFTSQLRSPEYSALASRTRSASRSTSRSMSTGLPDS